MGRPPLIMGLGVASEWGVDFAARYGLQWEIPLQGTSHSSLIVLIADVDDERLAEAAERGFQACCELPADDREMRERLLPALARGGLYLSLSTATAHATNVARHFRRRLEVWLDLPVIVAADIETALHEAVTNAVLHGNLEIPQSMPETQQQLTNFARLVEERLAQSVLAARRLVITADPKPDGLGILVRDQGEGYGSHPSFGASRGGLGLQTIYGIARSVSVSEGGRCIVMEFAR